MTFGHGEVRIVPQPPYGTLVQPRQPIRPDTSRSPVSIAQAHLPVADPRTAPWLRAAAVCHPRASTHARPPSICGCCRSRRAFHPGQQSPAAAAGQDCTFARQAFPRKPLWSQKGTTGYHALVPVEQLTWRGPVTTMTASASVEPARDLRIKWPTHPEMQPTKATS
jgi:hypothetical protein